MKNINCQCMVPWGSPIMCLYISNIFIRFHYWGLRSACFCSLSTDFHQSLQVNKLVNKTLNSRMLHIETWPFSFFLFLVYFGLLELLLRRQESGQSRKLVKRCSKGPQVVTELWQHTWRTKASALRVPESPLRPNQRPKTRTLDFCFISGLFFFFCAVIWRERTTDGARTRRKEWGMTFCKGLMVEIEYRQPAFKNIAYPIPAYRF